MSDHQPGLRRSAVLVAVPEAAAVVDDQRIRLDPAASWGVPPHVTVLYPFVPPEAIDDEVLARLRDAAGSVPEFDCVFARTAWFDEDVVWLAPEPDAPFRRLTQAVWQAFPQHPPYLGEVDQPVPHLTVGQLGSLADRRAAETAVRARLPVATRVSQVSLLAGTDAPASWQVLHEVPLGRPTR